MTVTRRLRAGSPAGMTADLRAASQPIQWPITAVTPAADPAVQARVLNVFEGLISTRARDDWRPSDISLSARLARLMILIDQETLLLEAEGLVQNVGGRSGVQPVRNPRADALASLAAQQASLVRALSLHGSPVDKRDLARGAKAEGQARAVIARVADESLL